MPCPGRPLGSPCHPCFWELRLFWAKASGDGWQCVSFYLQVSPRSNRWPLLSQHLDRGMLCVLFTDRCRGPQSGVALWLVGNLETSTFKGNLGICGLRNVSLSELRSKSGNKTKSKANKSHACFTSAPWHLERVILCEHCPDLCLPHACSPHPYPCPNCNEQHCIQALPKDAMLLKSWEGLTRKLCDCLSPMLIPWTYRLS